MQPRSDTRSRLRFWALLQFLYDASPPYGHVTLDDVIGSFRYNVWRTVLAGHLNSLHFICLDDDFPALKSKASFVNHTLLQIGIDSLRSLAGKTAGLTGVLPRYAAAELAHLLACKECQTFVQETIREDIKLTRFLREVGRDGNLIN